MSTAYEELAERLGSELAKCCIAVFKDVYPSVSVNGSVGVPSCDDVLVHEAYYVSRLMHTLGTEFNACVFRTLDDTLHRLFAPAVVEDAIKFFLCNYPTPREQFHVLLNPHAFVAAKERYETIPPYCASYCICYKHYDWAPPKGSVKECASSGSMTPDQSETTSERPTSPPPTACASPSLVSDERDLEEFLARANLSHLYATLRGANMWVDLLRSIPLGQLHQELMTLVPHRAHRQRLIDAMHSTVEIRASHKDKQGMWYRARDEGRTVYIRGIEGLTDFELREYLGKQHGPVVDMRYMFDPRNNSFLGYGFVMFAQRDAVDSILRRTSYQLREGVTICVKCSDELNR